VQSYSRLVCTVRRDLTSLSLFHAQLTDLLINSEDRNQYIRPPPFPDPFLIAAAEEGLAESSSQHSNRFTRQMRQTKREDLFAYSSSMRVECPKVTEGLESLGLDRALEEIQDYLRAVFALVETLDVLAFSPDEESEAFLDIDGGLLSQIGKLIGTFLASPEQEEKNLLHLSHVPPPEQSVSMPTSPSFYASAPHSPMGRMKRSTEEAQPAVPPHLVGWPHHRNKACWCPYVSSGLKIRLNLSDDQGGRLSMKSDEELLRAQGARCVGCGEPISVQWGFLGIDRNFQPCRFHGGLFCRKWCHADDRRQIPHRMLLHWDHNTHRVSKQAARFLDALWSQPMLLLNTANPLLYEGVPALRLARNMRGRAVQLIKGMLKSDAYVERQDVMDLIIGVLGPEKAHLCLSKELYSIADLVGVQTGDMLAALESFIGALREKDRTLGANQRSR
jgi:hypothetical protein